MVRSQTPVVLVAVVPDIVPASSWNSPVKSLAIGIAAYGTDTFATLLAAASAAPVPRGLKKSTATDALEPVGMPLSVAWAVAGANAAVEVKSSTGSVDPEVGFSDRRMMMLLTSSDVLERAAMRSRAPTSTLLSVNVVGPPPTRKVDEVPRSTDATCPIATWATDPFTILVPGQLRVCVLV